MRFLIPLVAAIVIVVAYVLVKRFADEHERERIQDFEASLEGQDFEGRSLAVQTAITRSIRQDATLFRSAVSFSVVVVVVAFLCLAWLQDTADKQGAEITRACDTDLEFRRLLDQQLTEDIRVRQGQRDDLADAIARTSTDIRELPGYGALPLTVQAFLDNLIEAQVVEAQAQIAEADEDLRRLRSQVDEIRAFNIEQRCQ